MTFGLRIQQQRVTYFCEPLFAILVALGANVVELWSPRPSSWTFGPFQKVSTLTHTHPRSVLLIETLIGDFAFTFWAAWGMCWLLGVYL